MNYDDILNRTWEEIPEPVLLPNGGWLLAGKNAALVKPKDDTGKSLKVLFSYQPKEAVSVRDDDIEALGDYDISINDLQFTIYIETASDWTKVRKHLALHGVEMEGAILDENGKLAFNKAFRGSEVVAEVAQRSYDDANGDTIWQNNLSKFRKVAE